MDQPVACKGRFVAIVQGRTCADHRSGHGWSDRGEMEAAIIRDFMFCDLDKTCFRIDAQTFVSVGGMLRSRGFHLVTSIEIVAARMRLATSNGLATLTLNFSRWAGFPSNVSDATCVSLKST